MLVRGGRDARHRLGQPAAGVRLGLGHVDAGRDDGHADRAFHGRIQRRADDDVGVGIDLFADLLGRLVHLEQGQVVAAGDVDENALGAVQADLVQQRVGDRLFGGFHGAVVARALARAHHGLAHLVHDRAHVGEVEVDEARTDHQVGHALDALIQHVVGHREGFGEGGLFVRESEQVLVRNDDEGVHDLLQRLDAFVGLPHPLAALELEGLGDDADGQDPHFARGLGDDRGRAGAGAAAHAGGDEAHMRAHQVIDDILDRFLGGFRADRRLRARAKALGHFRAKLHARFRPALRQRLRVGVGDHEGDAVQLLFDHVVDRVAARAADAEDGDARTKLVVVVHHEVQ